MNFKLKALILCISVSINLFLNFAVGTSNIFGLGEILQNLTGYFFAVSISFLDYALLSFIPFFAIYIKAKRLEFKFSDFLEDVFIILFWVILSFLFGLFILTFTRPFSSPYMPEYLLTEPIYFYSELFIALGIIIPFFIRKKRNKLDHINDIGSEV